MALSATFTANFASFYDAVDKADAKLKDFGSGADKVGTRLNALSNQFSGVKVVQEATLMAKAVEEIGGVTKLTEKELAKLGATTNEAVAKMKALGMDVPKNLQQIADQTKGANKASTDWLGTLTKMAGALGIAFSVGALTNFVGKVFDAAANIKDMADRLGIGIEAAQRFKYAAEQTGASIENVEKALSVMNRTLGTGGTSTRALLTDLGLDLDKLRAMKPEDAFIAMADAVAGIEDPFKQATVAAQLFGKDVAKLLPAMREGFVKLGAQTKVWSDQQVKDLEAAQQAWKNLGQTVVRESGQAMLDLARVMQTLSGARKSSLVWEGQVRSKDFGKDIDLVSEATKTLGKTLDELEDEQKQAAAAAKQHADALRKVAAEVAEHNQLWRNRIILLEGMEAFNRDVARAEDQRRAGLIASKVAAVALTDAEQAAFRHNALALFQRGDQILANEQYLAGVEAMPGAQLKYTAATETSTKASQDFSESLSAIAGAFAQLGQITGGGLGGVAGGIGAAIGSLDVAVKSAKNIGQGFGQTITGITGVVGAMAAVAQIVTKIGQKAWEIKVLRNDFIRAAGGAEALRIEAERAGVSLDNLYAAKEQADVEAAIKRITEAIAFQDAAMQTLTETAERYGFTLEELGPAFARQKLDEQAQQLFKDWEVLNTAGIDTIAITERMGESVSAYVNDAIKMGTEVPAAMRPMLEAFARSGQLLDENGNAITDLEGAGLDFTLTMSQGFRDLISEVEKLTDAISRGLGLAVDEGERRVSQLANNPQYRSLGPGMGYVANYQEGTHGFKNFGKGTPVMLHGWEAVVPRDEANATVTGGMPSGTGGAATSVVINAQGAFFDTPESLQRLATKVGDALTAKYSVMGKLRAAV